MKRRILLAIVGATLISGCASLGQTQVVATPWGFAGVHAFAANPVATEAMPVTDEAISKMLRDQSDDVPDLVAQR